MIWRVPSSPNTDARRSTAAETEAAARRSCRRHCLRPSLCGLVEDALDLAAVDVEFSGYGTLTLARLVPRADGLLQGRRSGEFGRCFLYQGDPACRSPFSAPRPHAGAAADGGIPGHISGDQPAASARACKAVRICAQAPVRCQRRNSPYTDSHGPYRSGRSRHGAPARSATGSIDELASCARRRTPWLLAHTAATAPAPPTARPSGPPGHRPVRWARGLR